MVASWLLENFNPAGFSANIFEGSDREVGNSWVPLTDGRITWLRWYRPSTTPAQKPTILRVWDTTTGTVLYTLGSIPDNGVVGWQASAVPEIPVVLAGRKYVVSTAWQTNRQHPLYGLGTFPPPNFPLEPFIPLAYQTASGTIGMPTTAQQGSVYGVDVRVRSQNRPLQWESVGTTAFDTEIIWNVPANRYVLTLTTIPQWQSAVLVGTVDVRRVPGFWVPILQGSYGQQGRIENTVDSFSLPGWQLMDGILIRAYPGTIGTLEGFVVDDTV